MARGWAPGTQAHRERGPRGRFVCTWTEQEDAELRELYVVEGMTYAAIARVMGKSRAAVAGRRQKLGLKRALVLAEYPGWRGLAGKGRKYWTNERVVEALRDYARAHPGELPRGTPAWNEICRGRQLPNSVRILEQFGALTLAWKAVLPAAEYRARVPVAWSRWTPEEEDLIRELAERVPMREIAARLGRSESSVRAHARRRLGVTQAANRGWWLPREVAEHYGCPLPRVYQLIWRGVLPSKRTTVQQIDARVLPGVASDYDRRAAAEEFGAERLEAIAKALTAPSQRAPKPYVLRRHRGPGRDDVITRVRPADRMAS